MVKTYLDTPKEHIKVLDIVEELCPSRATTLTSGHYPLAIPTLSQTHTSKIKNSIFLQKRIPPPNLTISENRHFLGPQTEHLTSLILLSLSSPISNLSLNPRESFLPPLLCF